MEVDGPLAGFVYVMSNPSFVDGMLKIGKSSKDPEEFRKAELESTGVPAPFAVEYYVFVDDYDGLEHKVHSALSEYRNYENREFFTVPVGEAIETIKEIAGSSIKFEKLSENAEEELSGAGDKEGSSSVEQTLYLYSRESPPESLEKEHELAVSLKQILHEYIELCRKRHGWKTPPTYLNIEIGGGIVQIFNPDPHRDEITFLVHTRHASYLGEEESPSLALKFKRLIPPLGWRAGEPEHEIWSRLGTGDANWEEMYWVPADEHSLREGNAYQIVLETCKTLARISEPESAEICGVYEIDNSIQDRRSDD